MARPPARAGGRSGLLSGGKSGKSKGFSLPSPKGHLPTPPARPAGGRAVTSVPMRGPQARYQERSTASPHTTPPEKGVPGEEPPPPGVLSPISSQEMGPRLGKPRFPARSNGDRKERRPPLTAASSAAEYPAQRKPSANTPPPAGRPPGENTAAAPPPGSGWRRSPSASPQSAGC